MGWLTPIPTLPLGPSCLAPWSAARGNRALSGSAEETRCPPPQDLPDRLRGWRCLQPPFRDSGPRAREARRGALPVGLPKGRGDGSRGLPSPARPRPGPRPQRRSRRHACPAAPPPGQGARQQGRATSPVRETQAGVGLRRGHVSGPRSQSHSVPWGGWKESGGPGGHPLAATPTLGTHGKLVALKRASLNSLGQRRQKIPPVRSFIYLFARCPPSRCPQRGP